MIKFLLISAVFSKLFSKHDDLEIPPPPPPFPKVDVKEQLKKPSIKEEIPKPDKKALKKEEKLRLKELDKLKQLEEKRKKKETKKAKLKEKKLGIPPPLEISEKKGFIGKVFGKKPEEKLLPEEDFKKLHEELKSLGGEIKLPEIKIPEIKKQAEILDAEEEIQRAIKQLAKEEKKPSRLFKKRIERQEIEPTPMPKVFEKIDKVHDVEEKMRDARKMLMDFNLKEAKNIYIEIMQIYNNMDIKEKEKVYPYIRDLYEERKNAESLGIT